ncbi:MAG: NAD(P)-dependent alcohol dehydrogenase [Paracoccaceae bacterium]
MKAITYTAYGKADVLHLQDLPKPTPGADEILVKIHATTVTPVDTAFRAGSPYFARLYTGLFKPKRQILGTELAGRIEAIGTDVTRFQPGDDIFAATADGSGAHAEYITLPETGAQTHMPENMGYDQAATLSNGGLTALPFLRDNGKIKVGDRVLINGASGAIGSKAVQLAKHFGAHVTGVASTANLDFVKHLGADAVIDYTKTDITTLNQTYDIIFDTSGTARFEKFKHLLTNSGRFLTTDLSLSTLFHMLATLFSRKKAIFAATGLRPADAQSRDMNFLKTLIENGTLKTTIDRSYTLENIAKAHKYVESGRRQGSVVITVAPREISSQAA